MERYTSSSVVDFQILFLHRILEGQSTVEGYFSVMKRRPGSFQDGTGRSLCDAFFLWIIVIGRNMGKNAHIDVALDESKEIFRGIFRDNDVRSATVMLTKIVNCCIS